MMIDISISFHYFRAGEATTPIIQYPKTVNMIRRVVHIIHTRVVCYRADWARPGFLNTALVNGIINELYLYLQYMDPLYIKK